MATGNKKLLQIIGRVVDRQTNARVAALRVEAWDKGLLIKEPVATAVTDQQGSFTIEFKKSFLRDLFGERDALLFFRVLRDDNLIASTQDSIIWSRDSADQEITIVVKPPDEPVDPGKKPKPIKLIGQVRGKDGSPVHKAIVRGFITTPEKEILLGEAQTDSTGNYVITSGIDHSLPQPANAQLEARVFDKQGAMVAASSSPILERSTTVDVVVTTPPPVGPNIVRGQVLHAAGKPLDSGTVRIIGVIPSPKRTLGEATITKGDDGRYLIQYGPGEFDPDKNQDARVVVQVFGSNENVLVSSPLFRANAEEVADLKTELEPPELYNVHGRITKGGQPLADAIVRAFNEDVTGTPLGETRSSSQASDLGSYLITYTVGPTNSSITKPPNLLIAVFDGKDVLGESDPPVRPATPDETINVDTPVIPPPLFFSIAGRVVDRNRPRRSVAGLTVEAWHKEDLLNKLIGRSLTGPQGGFFIAATREYFAKLSIPPRPDIFFRVYSHGRLINCSEEPFLEDVESGRSDIVIEVSVPVPQVLDGPALVSNLGPRLVGPRADGVRPDSPPETVPPQVVWVDAGDEVLVHLDSLNARVLKETLLVSLDLETDQTGRSPLVCAFALGGVGDQAGLLAVTEELPQGNPLLAARWGRAVQAAIWNGLLELADEQAKSRNAAPLGISITQGKLQLRAGEALVVRPGQ